MAAALAASASAGDASIDLGMVAPLGGAGETRQSMPKGSFEHALATAIAAARSSLLHSSVVVSSPAGVLSGLVPLSAEASVGFGRVAWVDFVVDGKVVGSASSAPYRYVWNAAAAPAGTHHLRAAVWSDFGVRHVSRVVTVTSRARASYTRVASRRRSLAGTIASLPPGGGSVYVPAGTYTVASLVLPSGVTLVGAGSSTVLRTPAGAPIAIRVQGRGVTVSNLAVDATAAPAAESDDYAIAVSPGSSDVLLQGLTITASQGDAIHIWGPHQRVSIQDSTITGAGTASSGVMDRITDDGSSDTSVLRTRVAGFLNYGINFYPWTPGRVYVGARAVAAHDTIVEIQNPATDDGTNESGIWSGGESAVIFGNRVDDTGWDGIETFGRSNGSHVIANVVTNTKAGIYLEHSTNDSLVSRNLVGNARTGIVVEWLYGGVGSQRNIFRSNTITGAFQGIHIGASDDYNLIEKNTIRGSPLDQALVLDSSMNIVRANRIEPAPTK